MNTDTLANGLKAVFGAAQQTSVAYVPTCASDGTPTGIASKQTLRSEIGTRFVVLQSGDDLNDMIPPATGLPIVCANKNTNIGGSLLNSPTAASFIMESFANGDGGYYLQRITIIGNAGANTMYIRRKSNSQGWSDWVHYTYDT